jgi:hypothetical protein
MLIDCDGCAARGPGCPDCVVTVLLGASPSRVELDEVERQALAVLADGGLVPPLRLVLAAAEGAEGDGDDIEPPRGRAAGERAARPSGRRRHAAG